MVFVSYAREDAEQVGRIIGLMSERLWLEVWSDRKIEIGTSFTRSIATALGQAWVVVVFWTKHSIESEFVLDEARRALAAEKLFPVRLEDVNPPLGFGGLQQFDLFAPPPEHYDKDPSWDAFLDGLVTRISQHVELGRLIVRLNGDERNERELATYFTRNRRISVLCGRAASMAVLPFYWGLALLGFRATLEDEPEEASGQNVLPILEAIDEADLVLFALYPPTISSWYIELCYKRAGGKACFVVFGSLTAEKARSEYPFLSTVPDSRFLHKRWIGFPLKGDGTMETWNTIRFILEATQ